MTTKFVPQAPPQIIENAYTDDQHARLLKLVRDKGPWEMILAQHFKSPEEVLATTSGVLPEGFKPTWEMFMSPVFRGYLAKGATVLYPEIEDCFYNSKFTELARAYWKAEYARPENMLFNIQGPCRGSDTPHVDATNFRGVDSLNSPVWLMNMMVKSGLFEQWRCKKAQVITWYYQGKVGGGFNYWPNGPQAEPAQIKAPMWSRAVVVENEMMYHTAEATGPANLRWPEGLNIKSKMAADPNDPTGWLIKNDDQVIQSFPAEEFRFLLHWGCDIYIDYADLKRSLDHTDDITQERVFDTLIADMRARGMTFEIPSDPLTDENFITLLTRTYDPGKPAIFPPEPEEALAA